MSSAILILLVCLAVICDGKRWPPIIVPSAAQQCINKGKGYVGECMILETNFTNLIVYTDYDRCDDLYCAKPLFNGKHVIVRAGKPLDGTRCSQFGVCCGDECVPVSARHLPAVIGSNKTVDCYSLNAFGDEYKDVLL